jgi:hypothetical protein
MQYSSAILVVACAILNVVAHGVITEVQGANGVVMPGLSSKNIRIPFLMCHF